jgi:hypothetical protein
MVLLGLSAPARPASTKTLAYHSREWGFCVNYPAGWHAQELFEGRVLRLAPDLSRCTDGRPRPSASQQCSSVSVSIGGFLNQNHEGGPTKEKDWDEIVDDGLDALRDDMATQVSETRHETQFAGLPALLSDISYRQNGQRRHDRYLRIRRPDAIVIELEVSAPVDHFASAIDALTQLTHSLNPTCSEPSTRASR